ARPVSALAVEHDRLVIGYGEDGVQIVQIPSALLHAHNALSTPLDDLEVISTDLLSLSIPETAGVTAVRYLVNGQRVATADAAPFERQVRVPANLLNGNRFTLQTEVEHFSGRVTGSPQRTLLLRSSDMISNPFQLSLEFPAHSWGPAPLALKAVIQGSEQPVARVEYYLAEQTNGPWQLIGTHQGPEYVLKKAYGIEHSGWYLKARAIDVFGNVAETAPAQFYRYQDNVDPRVTVTVVGDGVTQNGTRVVAGTAYRVDVHAQDQESGLERVLLERNGELVAARFENGVLSYSVTSAVTGSDLYTVEVVDAALNRVTVSHSLSTVTDNKPSLELLSTPAQIREQSDFAIQVSAQDDVAVAYIEVLWNGFSKRFDFQRAEIQSVTLNLKDQRAERVIGSLSQ